MPDVLDTEPSRVADYVRRQGSCEPGVPAKVASDPNVWKVPVESFNDSWTVPPPRFWWVCTRGALNLYRDDVFRSQPWCAEQKETTVIDYVKSFHLGLMMRMGMLDGGNA